MKEAKEYWESLSIKKQDHFLKDHKNEFNRSSWLGWLGKDFDKLPANVQKVISKHVEEGVYKSGGSFSDFLAKAKTKAKSAYSSTKKGAKEISVKAKDTYSKTEKAVKDKIHQKKKEVALDVIYDAKENLSINRDDVKTLSKAFDVIEDKYAKGSTIDSHVVGGKVSLEIIDFLEKRFGGKFTASKHVGSMNSGGFVKFKKRGEDYLPFGTEWKILNKLKEEIEEKFEGRVGEIFLSNSQIDIQLYQGKYAKGTNINKENYDLNYLFSELTKIYTNRDSETYKELRAIKFKANKEVDFWDLVWAIGTDLQEKTQNKFQVKQKDGFYTWANRLAEHVCEELADMLLKKEGVSLEKQSEDEYAKGTNIKKVDLFEYPEMIPNNVQKVLDHYSESFEDGDYSGLQEAEEELSYIGYTFEYGLDGQAYALRPINVKVKELEGYEDYKESNNESEEDTDTLSRKQILEETLSAIGYMLENVNSWAIRNTAAKLSHLDFYNEAIAVADEDTAYDILSEARDYVRRERANEYIVDEIYDLVGQYSQVRYCCGGQMYRTGGNMTKYVFVNVVQGNYGYGWEDLTTHDTRLEAKKEMKVYDENERYAHRVITRKVLRTDYEKGNYAKGSNIDKKITSKGDKYFVLEQYDKKGNIFSRSNLSYESGVKDIEFYKKFKSYVYQNGAFYHKDSGDLAFIIRESKLYSKGGHFENENREMVLNNNKQIAHHTKELQDAVKGKKVPAWVVAKVNRSASDLSDATHYMEGQSEKYAKGSNIERKYRIYYNKKWQDIVVSAKNKDEAFEISKPKLEKIYNEKITKSKWAYSNTYFQGVTDKYENGSNVSSEWTKQLTNDENELACSIMNRIVKPGPYVDCNNLKYANKKELKKAIEKNMNMLSADGKKIATSLLSKLN
jgi:hypothetical protein